MSTLIKQETFDVTVSSIRNSADEFKTIQVSSKSKVGDLFHPVKGGYAYWAIIRGNDLPMISGLAVTFKVNVVENNGKRYYNCVSWQYCKPDSKSSIRSFLESVIGKVGLISKAKIKELVDTFGNDTLEKFRVKDSVSLMPFFAKKAFDPEGLEKLEKAIKLVNTSGSNVDFIRDMSELGISPTVSRKITQQLGFTSLEDVKADPYACMEIGGIGFGKCEFLAKSLKSDMKDEKRLLYCTKGVIESRLQGSVYMNAEDVKNEVLKTLYKSCPEVKITGQDWAQALNNNSKLEDKAMFFTFKNGNKISIMLQQDNVNEATASQVLHRLLNDTSPRLDRESALRRAKELNESGAAQRGFKLTDEQVEAVANTLSSKVSIITGGPGTGKTTITQMIIALWERFYPNLPVTCMAPTGKAATRMSEQTGKPAHTIHKTVKIIPGEDGESVHLVTIEKGLIIVDESSMIDQDTLTKMLTCVPVGSTLLFLGDIDQLPSVGRGDCLNQMIKSGKIVTSRLTATKRQADGSPIIENATKINHCSSDLRWVDGQFSMVSGTDNDLEKFKRLYVEKVKKYGGISKVAVLTPLRQPGKMNYKMCSQKLNLELRELANKPKSEDDKGIEINTQDDKIRFRKGDRVMSWKNKDEVANGDIGQIIDITMDEFNEYHFAIRWETGIISSYSREEMKGMSLAYAMSIHKSQGSEYDCVIIPLLSEQSGSSVISKNLIYTGVTRAKKEVIIFGDKKALEKGCQNVQANNRKSFLALRLSK